MSDKITPPFKESPEFSRTLNKKGYTSTLLNHYTQSFLEFIKPNSTHVLDIGAAFGALTIEALKRGAFVTANDMEIRHLKILQEKIPLSLKSHLEIKEGLFPDNLNFPENSFDIIVISQVLHFLSGPHITTGLRKAFEWLNPNGKIFLTAVTPYTSVLEEFLPLYKKRKEEGLSWPGTVEELSLYCHNQEIRDNNPPFMNFLDKDILEDACREAGFLVEDCGFFARGDFPNFLKGNGSENIGLIGIKPDQYTSRS
jgi:SAM-dependent methyltransferase